MQESPEEVRSKNTSRLGNDLVVIFVIAPFIFLGFSALKGKDCFAAGSAEKDRNPSSDEFGAK